jgi:hypothetical protein
VPRARKIPACRRCGFRPAEAHVVLVDGRFELVGAYESTLCGACAGAPRDPAPDRDDPLGLGHAFTAGIRAVVRKTT